MSIESELLNLKHGEFIVAEDVVAWARKHPESELHKQFEWDTDKAAQEHWLWQARRLIAIHIVYEGGDRRMVSLVVDRSRDGGGYRDIEDVLKDRSLYEIMLKDALAELERVQLRYQQLKELKPVWSTIKKIAAKHGKRKGGDRKRPAA